MHDGLAILPEGDSARLLAYLYRFGDREYPVAHCNFSVRGEDEFMGIRLKNRGYYAANVCKEHAPSLHCNFSVRGEDEFMGIRLKNRGYCAATLCKGTPPECTAILASTRRNDDMKTYKGAHLIE